MAYTFRALATFVGENRSTYIEGLSYQVADENRLLDELTQEWLAAGKIEMIECRSVVSAIGKVE